MKPTDFEAFGEVVRPLVEETTREEGSLAYEYHVDSGRTEIHIIERYLSSEAVVHHVTKTFSQFAERFTALATVSSFVVYGDPNREARAILDGFGAVYLSNFDGFIK